MLNRWWLWGLVAAAFVVRLAAVAAITGFDTPPSRGTDESEYNAIAWNVAQGRGYRGPSPDVDDQDHTTAYRPPTTPLIYAALFAIFGHTYLPLHIANAALAALTVVLVEAITRRYAGGPAAMIAAILYAFYPPGIYYSSTILSEIHAAFLTSLFAWCCLGIKRPRGAWWAIAAGVSLGALLLCKPGFVFVFPLFPILGWLVFGGNARYWGRGVVLLAGTLLVLAPWVIRNHLVMHAFIPFGTGGGQLLASVNNRVVVEDPLLYGYSIMDSALPENAAALRAPNDEVERDKVAKALGLAWLKSNPDKWFYLLQGRFRRLWTPMYYGQGNRAAAVVNGLYYGSVLVLFVIGFVPLTRRLVREKDPALVMHLLILTTVIGALVFHGQHRYRFSIDAFCVSIAACTLVHVRELWVAHSAGSLLAGWLSALRRRRGVVALAAGAGAVIGGLWVADQRRIENYRRGVCVQKLELIGAAVRQFRVRHHRFPGELSELVPEFLPNLDSLHCPEHSIGWINYELLKSDDPEGKEFVISYCLHREAATGAAFLTDERPLHSGQANRFLLSQ